MGKRHVKITRLNWDIEYFRDIQRGDGFTITEPASVTIDGNKKKSLYGPRSELYGTSYEDEQQFVERFQCKCGTFRGRMYEGETCPFCGEVVKDVGDNIKITGWISLGIDKIINPYFYHQLESAIGKAIFNDMVISRKKVDRDGHISVPDISIDPDHPPLSPFSGIGINEFRMRYYEIMEFFMKKRKQKKDKILYLIENSRMVFTSHIPVYSTKLRQQSITADTFYFGGLDKQINPIISLSKLLVDCSEIEQPYYLQQIQKKVNAMWEYNFELLNGKDGFIRGEMKGGSLNYTSRNVIIPNHELHDNEVDMSYHTFLELFRETIIRYIMVTEGCLFSESYRQWNEAKIQFSEKIYSIMCYIIDKEKPKILLNRNPTLNYYSMLLLNIRKVKRDFDDYTLSVPLAVNNTGNAASIINHSNCGEVPYQTIKILNCCSDIVVAMGNSKGIVIKF